MCLWKLLLFPSWRNQQFLVCWSLEVGAHKDSGWDPRPQELTKRRGVLEESGGRPRRPEESGGRPRSPLESGGHLEESGGREQRPSSESVCGVRVEEWGGRPRSPSAESVWRSAEAVRGVRRSAWASQLWGGQGCYHQHLMGRGQGCGPMSCDAEGEKPWTRGEPRGPGGRWDPEVVVSLTAVAATPVCCWLCPYPLPQILQSWEGCVLPLSLDSIVTAICVWAIKMNILIFSRIKCDSWQSPLIIFHLYIYLNGTVLTSWKKKSQ